jgi:hypothetical protein
MGLANSYLQAEDFERAAEWARRAMGAYERSGDAFAATAALANLGAAQLALGEDSEAVASLRAAASRGVDLGGTLVVTWCLGGLAAAALRGSRLETAARLLGASRRLRREINAELEPFEQRREDAVLATLREEFPGARLEELLVEGEVIPLQELIRP